MKPKNRPLKIALIVLFALLAIFSIVSLIFVKKNFDDIFARTAPSKYTAYLRYDDVKEDYERELLSFPSGKNQLQGYLYGAGNPKGLVVISHGMGGYAESYLAETLYFVDHGYQVFGFDNTGCNNSEGKSCIGLCQSVIDLDAALTYIESNPRFASLPVYLYGHSWGGYAVTAIFNYDHNITASASVAGFNKPMEMIMEWGKDMMGMLADIEYPFIYLNQKSTFGKNLNLTAVDGINRTDTPILIIHGNKDETVKYGGAAIIAYRSEITNPNVRYKICEAEKQNDHNHLFVAMDSITYVDELNEAYDKLYDKYDGKIPDEEDAEFYSRVDKKRTSRMDEAFMQDVLAFYESAAN